MKALKRKNFHQGAKVLICSALALCLSQTVCVASIDDMSADLPDDYLRTEFSWVMVLDLPDVTNCLNYPDSHLCPLTKISVRARKYPRDENWRTPTNTFYEDLWYKNDQVLGLRRSNQISLDPGSSGAIIVCPPDSEADPYNAALAITDAIVRLVVDVQFHNALTGIVLVPRDQFLPVAKALIHYKFYPPGKGATFGFLSIRLRSYPDGRDQLFYLRN